MIGPRSGAWEILDGQQRVATTTMLFSAIRQWLDAAGFEEDARQIEEEFIGLRQLGQSPSSRLTMNVNDREIFSELVFQKTPLQQVKNIADKDGIEGMLVLQVKARESVQRLLEQWEAILSQVADHYNNLEGKVF